MNGAIKALHQALHNGHTKARSCNLGHTKATIPLEGCVNLFQKLFAHATAGILNHKAKASAVILVLVPPHHKGYFASGRGILQSVGQNIIQNLVQALQITADINRCKLHILTKILLLQLSLSAEHFTDFPHRCGHIKALLQMLHLAIIKARHLQDIVNQGQKLLARGLNLLDIIKDQVLILAMQLSQLCHANDAINGRTHIVGHGRKEHVAGFGIFLRHLQGTLRKLHMLQLLELFGIHLAEEEDGLIRAQKLIPNQTHIDPFIFLTKALPKFTAKIVNLPLHQILNIIQGKGFCKLCCGFRLYQGYQLLQKLIIGAIRLRLDTHVFCLHHGITTTTQIYSKDSQKGFAHNLNHIVDILHLLIQHMLTGSQKNHHQGKNSHGQHKPL